MEKRRKGALFGMTFEDVAATVGRTPAAVRKLVARARKHVGEGAPRIDVDRNHHRQVVGRFLAAAAGGYLSALVDRRAPPDTGDRSD